VKGSENIILPSFVTCLLQVKEDSNKVLTWEKGTLYMVFQVHQVVKGRYVASKSILSTGENVSALQYPHK
jgi:hypothetical protein